MEFNWSILAFVAIMQLALILGLMFTEPEYPAFRRRLTAYAVLTGLSAGFLVVSLLGYFLD